MQRNDANIIRINKLSQHISVLALNADSTLITPDMYVFVKYFFGFSFPLFAADDYNESQISIITGFIDDKQIFLVLHIEERNFRQNHKSIFNSF